MAKVRSHHTTDLGLPDGSILRPHVVSTIKRWDVLQNHNVVKTWIAAKVLEVLDDGEDDAPTPVPAPAVATTANTPPDTQPAAPVVTATDGTRIDHFTNIDDAKTYAKAIGINVHWKWALDKINEEIAAKAV